MTKKKIIAGFMALSIAMSTAALPCGAVDNTVNSGLAASYSIYTDEDALRKALNPKGYTADEYIKKLDDMGAFYEINSYTDDNGKFHLSSISIWKYGAVAHKKDNWVYSIYNGGAYILRYFDTDSFEYIDTLHIPEEIDGVPVVGFGDYSGIIFDYDEKTDSFVNAAGGIGCSEQYVNNIYIPASIKNVTSLPDAFSVTTIYCQAGSSAYNYAVEKGIKYVLVDKNGNPIDSDNFINIAPEINTAYSSTTNSVRISWNKVEKASGYRVYRYNSEKAKWEIAKTISGGNTTTFKDTNLDDGTVYKYKVKAYAKTNGGTAWGYNTSTTVATATKPKKVTFTASSSAKTAVKLKWNKINATGYKLQQYNAATKTWKTVKVLKQSETEYKVTGLKKGTSYKFRIQAYKTGGVQKAFGAWSEIKTVTTKK